MGKGFGFQGKQGTLFGCWGGFNTYPINNNSIPSPRVEGYQTPKIVVPTCQPEPFNSNIFPPAGLTGNGRI